MHHIIHAHKFNMSFVFHFDILGLAFWIWTNPSTEEPKSESPPKWNSSEGFHLEHWMGSGFKNLVIQCARIMRGEIPNKKHIETSVAACARSGTNESTTNLAQRFWNQRFPRSARSLLGTWLRESWCVVRSCAFRNKHEQNIEDQQVYWICCIEVLPNLTCVCS